MKKILIAFLLLIPATHVWAYYQVNGIIKDASGPVVGAHIQEQGTTHQAAADMDGNFSLAVDSGDSLLKISAIGYSDMQIKASAITKSIPIVLQESNEMLEETMIAGCASTPERKSQYHATTFKLIDDKCVPSTCEDGYILEKQDTANAVCTPCTSVIDKSVKTHTKDNTCYVETCAKGYEPDLAEKICLSTDCPCGQQWNHDQRTCISILGTTCDLKNQNATGKYACPTGDNGTMVCQIDKCIDGFDEVRNDKKEIVRCESNSGKDCLGTLPADSHATSATYNKNHECVIRSCSQETGEIYDLKDGKCVKRDTKTDQEIADLKDTAAAARANETSFVNKTITAAGMETTAVGAQMALSALSEQTADENIESEMRAYLETFRCEYGSNKPERGGATNVELPGGNDMFNLYAQYATLANDLKIRKEALGIKPGIESEIVIDKAETGLYDDVGTGITGGNYISVARALMNPDGEDAKRWAAQRAETAEKLETGIKVAAIGAAASLAANIAANGLLNNPLKKLEQQINSLPTQQECPSDSKGTYPACKCIKENYVLNFNSNTCEECTGGRVRKESADEQSWECECPDAKPNWNVKEQTCKAEPVYCEYQQETVGNKVNVTNTDCSTRWYCINGYDEDFEKETCVCNSDAKRERDGKCEFFYERETETTVETYTAELENKSLFATAKFDLTSNARKALDEFVQTELAGKGRYDCSSIVIIGYADPQGSAKSNLTLSQNRAKTVADYLEPKVKQYLSGSGVVTHAGKGETNCLCTEIKEGCQNSSIGDPAPDGKPYEPCRRVEVMMNCKQTSTSTQTTTSGGDNDAKKN